MQLTSPTHGASIDATIAYLVARSVVIKINNIVVLLETFIFVSEFDILGPNDNLSDIKNLVSFKRKLFEEFSYKQRIKIFLLFMSISPLEMHVLNIINGVHVNYMASTVSSITVR